MVESSLSFLAQNLLFQAPTLLVCLVGLILSLVFAKRCRSAAILAFIALAGMLVTAVFTSAVQAFLIHSMSEGDLTDGARYMTVLGVFGTVLRAGTLACLVAAVFVGRGSPPPAPRPTA